MGDIRAIVARLGTATVAVDQVLFASRLDRDPTGFMMATDRELLRRGNALMDVIGSVLRECGYEVSRDRSRGGLRVSSR